MKSIKKYAKRIEDKIFNTLDTPLKYFSAMFLLISLYFCVSLFYMAQASIQAASNLGTCSMDNYTRTPDFKGVAVFEVDFSSGCPDSLAGMETTEYHDTAIDEIILNRNINTILKNMTLRHEYCHYLHRQNNETYGYWEELDCYAFEADPRNY